MVNLIDSEIQLTPNRQNVIDFIIENRNTLLEKATIQDLFTITEKLKVNIDNPFVKSDIPIYLNRLVDVGKSTLYHITNISQKADGEPYELIVKPTKIVDNPKDRLICPRTRFSLHANQIDNFNDKTPIETTFGRYLLNQVLFVECFGDKIEYVNDTVTGKTLNALLKPYILDNTITSEQYMKFLANVTYLNIPEYIAPNVTADSFRTPQNIVDLKKKLVEEYGDRIASGDQVAMIEFEQKLIKLDEENLKGDLSERYLLSNDQKTVKRKKLFLSVGILERYGEPGKFDFIKNSLSDGWDNNDLSKMANEVRQGSQSRAIETQVSGEETIFILRVFQNLRIIEKDCKTTRHLKKVLTKENYKKYIGRYILENNKLMLLTESNIDGYISKTVALRTPLCCATVDGLCYTCLNKIFYDLKQENLATVIQNFSSMFLNSSLKKSHGKSHNYVRISSIGRYCI